MLLFNFLPLLLSLNHEFVAASTGKALDWSLGNTYTVDYILKKCPNLDPTRQWPMQQGVLPLEINFMMNKLYEISELEQTLTVQGMLTIVWNVQCSDPTFGEGLADTTIKVTPSTFWIPEVCLQNAVSDNAMMDPSFHQTVFANVNNSNGLTFDWTRRGVFKVVCPIDLQWFPFDRQTCKFLFAGITGTYSNCTEQSCPPSFRINLLRNEFLGAWMRGEIDSDNDFSLIPPNLEWQLESYDQYDNIDPMKKTAQVSTQKYVFKRKPSFYLINQLAPCIMLSVLELASFGIDPNSSDRSCFAVTILLAFAVIQSQTIQLIPRSPNRVFFLDYLLAQALYCSAVTLYSAVICFFFRYNFRKTPNATGRIIETVAFSIFAFAALVLNSASVIIAFNASV